jgi:hypothetical protein
MTKMLVTDAKALRSELSRESKIWKMGYDRGLAERQHKMALRLAIGGGVVLLFRRHPLVAVALVMGFMALALSFWPYLLGVLGLVLVYRLRPHKVAAEPKETFEPFPDDEPLGAGGEMDRDQFHRLSSPAHHPRRSSPPARTHSTRS